MLQALGNVNSLKEKICLISLNQVISPTITFNVAWYAE